MNELKKKIITKLALSARNYNEKHKENAKKITYLVLTVIVLINIIFIIPEFIYSVFKCIFEFIKKGKKVIIIGAIVILGVLGVVVFERNKDKFITNRENSGKNEEFAELETDSVKEDDSIDSDSENIVIEDNNNESESDLAQSEEIASEDNELSTEENADADNQMDKNDQGSDENIATDKTEEETSINTDTDSVSNSEIDKEVEGESNDVATGYAEANNNNAANTNEARVVESTKDDKDNGVAEAKNTDNVDKVSNDDKTDNTSEGGKSSKSENAPKADIASKSDNDWEPYDVDLTSLKDEYPETVGWLFIENTSISYPIMQGSDNEKYLKTGYTGEEANTGAIFLDYRSADDFNDSNSIVYGHNMKDKSMFGKLRDYRESKEYYDDHQYFQIITPDAEYRYKVFAYMDVPNDSVIYDYTGDAAKAFVADAEPVRIKSYMDSEIPVNKDDKVVILSTCTSQDDLRFVVLGVLVDTKR